MSEQINRGNVTFKHVEKCKHKLNILLLQRKNLTLAIEQLLEDLKNGLRIAYPYKQMKMYNDPSTDPTLI